MPLVDTPFDLRYTTNMSIDDERYFDGEVFDIRMHSHALSDEEIVKRISASDTSGVHVIKPLSHSNIETLSEGFAIAFWFCPNCGQLTSDIELIDTKPADKENKWHTVVSIQCKNSLRSASIY